MGLLLRVQWSATKMIDWSVFLMRRDRDNWDGSTWQREDLGSIYHLVKIPDGRKHRRESQTILTGAQWQDKRLQTRTETWETSCDHGKNILLTLRVVQHWNRLSTQLVESPFSKPGFQKFLSFPWCFSEVLIGIKFYSIRSCQSH